MHGPEALLLALVLPARAQFPALPQPHPAPQALDLLFDGTRALPEPPPPSAERRRVLYSEGAPEPAAPRYGLDLDAVPPELRTTIEGFERLHHKNQEETAEWVARTNRLIREANARRRFGKIPEWTYDGRANEPPWTCLADAAATAHDWWAQRLGKPVGAYRSATTGRTERGLDPHLLELEYFRRASQGQPDFIVPPKFIQKDPVRNTGFPYEPRGYAELLGDPEGYEVKDPITGDAYRWAAGQSVMEEGYKELFSNSILRERTPARYARVLAGAIDKWGVVYAQLEHTEHPRWPGAHAVVIVGYFCLADMETPVPCARDRTDAEWGEKTFFIAHDSFGKFPASRPRDADGASAYRAVRIASIDQALVFPHGLKLSAQPDAGTPGVWRLEISNKAARPVTVLALRALDAAGAEVAVPADFDGSRFVASGPGQTLRVYVEARHYFARDGQGRGFALTLDARGRTFAEELAR